jgi:hypothetical protein
LITRLLENCLLVKAPKKGIASARMKEIVTHPATVPSHTAQWTNEWALRCSEPLDDHQSSVGFQDRSLTEYIP